MFIETCSKRSSNGEMPLNFSVFVSLGLTDFELYCLSLVLRSFLLHSFLFRSLFLLVLFPLEWLRYLTWAAS